MISNMNYLSVLALLPVTVIFTFTSCNKIYTGEELDSKTIQQINRLGLLNQNEKIYQFYSNAPFRKANAGNFYSSQRIAGYWLDDRKERTQVNFAYYSSIARIDTTYLDKSLTYVSYLTITRKDGSHFKVYVGGKKPAVRTFFRNAIMHWKASTCAHR